MIADANLASIVAQFQMALVQRSVRVGAVGSRTWRDAATVFRVLDDLNARVHIVELVSGGAAGADSTAASWARKRRIPVVIYNADWAAFGKRAGAIRNRSIVDAIDIIVAFWDGLSRGTKITIDMAQRARKRVLIVRSAAASDSARPATSARSQAPLDAGEGMVTATCPFCDQICNSTDKQLHINTCEIARLIADG